MLGRDEDNSYLTLNGLAEDPLKDIHYHSATYRETIGPLEGRKLFILQAFPPQPELATNNAKVAKLIGFSLHAGVTAHAHQRQQPQSSAFRGKAWFGRKAIEI